MVGNSIVQFARVCPQQDRSIHSMAYPLWAVAQPGQTFPYNLVPYIVIAWIVLGIITFVYFRVKAPEKLAALGSFLAEDNLSEDRLMLEDATHSAHQAEAD
jgi:hypothetical protein